MNAQMLLYTLTFLAVLVAMVVIYEALREQKEQHSDNIHLLIQETPMHNLIQLCMTSCSNLWMAIQASFVMRREHQQADNVAVSHTARFLRRVTRVISASVLDLDTNQDFETKEVFVAIGISVPGENNEFPDRPINVRMVTPSNVNKIESFKTIGFEFDGLSQMIDEEVEEFHASLRSVVNIYYKGYVFQRHHALSRILKSIANDFGDRNGLRLTQSRNPFIVRRGEGPDIADHTGVHFDETPNEQCHSVRIWIPVSESSSGRINNLCLGVGDMSDRKDIGYYNRGTLMSNQRFRDITWYEEEECGAVWYRCDIPHFSVQRAKSEPKQRVAIIVEYSYEYVLRIT